MQTPIIYVLLVGYTNVMDDYFPPQGADRLVDEDKVRLRPEEKSVAFYKEIMHRYTSPGDWVVDFFAGTFASGIAAMQMGRRYFGAEIGTCTRTVRNYVALTSAVHC